MTATEELRLIGESRVESGYPHTLRPELHRALKAAGVDYEVAQGLTFWNCSDGRECVAYGYQVNGKPKLSVKIVGITDPEQAIAATLGAGTCHAIISDNLTESEGMGDAWADCSECGHLLFVLTDLNSEPPNYCPNCGRKVVDE